MKILKEAESKPSKVSNGIKKIKINSIKTKPKKPLKEENRPKNTFSLLNPQLSNLFESLKLQTGVLESIDNKEFQEIFQKEISIFEKKIEEGKAHI